MNVCVFIRKTIYVIFVFLTGIVNVFGVNNEDTIIISSQNKLELIADKFVFFEDKSSELTIVDILNPENQQKFTKYNKDVFTGPASKSAYWFKFTIQNNSDEDVWFESGGSYSAWLIDFYKPDSLGNYSEVVKTGALRPENQKEYPSEFYLFKLADDHEKGVKTFYARIISGVTPEIPFYVGIFKVVSGKNQIIISITYAFIGIMMMMFLYNLLLFFVTQDRIYLSYVFFVFMNTLCYTFNNNFTFFGDNTWWWEKHITWQFLGDLSSTVFILHFLNLRKNMPLAFKLYLGLITVDLIVAILNLLGVETVVLIDFYMLISLLLILNTIFTGIYLLIKQQPNAKIFMLSWSFLLVSIVIFMLVINGDLPYNLFTRYSVYLGISLETLLFSMALADRLRIERKEKEAALMENVILVKNINTKLERLVEERTQELAFKNDKLQAVLEEINQQNEKISKQNKELKRLSKHKKNLTNMIVHDLKNPLNLIINSSKNSLVIQSAKNILNMVLNILDVLKNTETQISLDRKEYSLLDTTEEAVSEVLFLANQKNISIMTEINAETVVNIDKEIVKRVCINILSNALKFTHYNGKISILSEEIKNQKDKPKSIKVSISDTGVGIPEDQLHNVFKKFGRIANVNSGKVQTYGIGLAFCKMAIEAHGGEIGVVSKVEQGATFWFTLPVSDKIYRSDIKEKKWEKKSINLSEQEKEYMKNIAGKLNKLEFYEVGEILKVINKIEMEKYPNVRIYAEKIKHAVLSGNLAEFEDLLYIQ